MRSVLLVFLLFAQYHLCAHTNIRIGVPTDPNRKILYVVNGDIFAHIRVDDKSIYSALPPAAWIESINIIKDTSAIDKYGKKGEAGVIEITTMFDKHPIFSDIESLPNSYIKNKIDWKEDYKRTSKISFSVSKKGKMKFKAAEKDTPKELKQQFKNIVNNAPKWLSVAIDEEKAVRAKGEIIIHKPTLKHK